jgi:hypothetical protein
LYITYSLKCYFNGMLQCNYKEKEVYIGMLTAVVLTVSILSLAWIVGQREKTEQ